jgi:winged helix-turn helix protein
MTMAITTQPMEIVDPKIVTPHVMRHTAMSWCNQASICSATIWNVATPSSSRRWRRFFFAVGQALGLHHQTVQRCVERAVAEGPLAALDDRPRPGREPRPAPPVTAPKLWATRRSLV